jgi:hypothetical protein
MLSATLLTNPDSCNSTQVITTARVSKLSCGAFVGASGWGLGVWDQEQEQQTQPEQEQVRTTGAALMEAAPREEQEARGARTLRQQQVLLPLLPLTPHLLLSLPHPGPLGNTFSRCQVLVACCF